jgi:hypothetical protein
MFTPKSKNFCDGYFAITTNQPVVDPDYENQNFLLSTTKVDAWIVFASGEPEFNEKTVKFSVPNIG